MRDPAAAEDIVQETFLDVFRGLPSFKGDSKIDTWIWKIAHNRIAKHFRRFYRKERNLVPLESLGPTGDPVCSRPGPAEQFEVAQIKTVVQHALMQLEPDERSIVILKDMEGFKNAEIAEMTGLGIGAVKSRLHRSRLRLRRIVLEHLRDGAQNYV